MTISHEVLRKITCSALFFSERSRYGIFGTDYVSTVGVDESLHKWKESIDRQDKGRFRRRLEWYPLKQNEAEHLLSPSLPISDSCHPEWENTIRDILLWFSQPSNYRGKEPGLGLENPIPFQDILLPFIGLARRRLRGLLDEKNTFSLDEIREFISREAWCDAELALLNRLFNISGMIFYHEFCLRRSFGYNLLSSVSVESEDCAQTTYYQNFVEELLDDGLTKLFLQYPVLARLMAVTIDFWVNSTYELITRLYNDKEEISKMLGISASQDIGKVMHITNGISDLHNQNRSVSIITFSSESKIVYKPKDLGLESAFCALLNWCNQEKFSASNAETILPFHVLRLNSKGDYGWVEYVEAGQCEDELAVHQFYIRAGQLACLLYVLGSTDCHDENLIASGSHPILVDMETILQPKAKTWIGDDSTNSYSKASDQLEDSVLRTGLLPMWEFTPDQSCAYDLSGLGSDNQQEVSVMSTKWANINTDQMHPVRISMNKEPGSNIPRLRGKVVSASDYLESLLKGYESMNQHLYRNRDFLLSDVSPITYLFRHSVRFIFRPTRIYATVLAKAINPKTLSSGIQWSLSLDILSRSFLDSENIPISWPLFLDEIVSLSQLDIPYFTVQASSSKLTLASGESTELFIDSCTEQVASRLKELDDSCLRQQLTIIRLAFYAKKTRGLHGTSTLEESETPFYTHPSRPYTDSDLIRIACEIGDDIKEHAIAGNDDSLSWISLGYVETAERFQLRPLGLNFYDGNCGIALFFASLSAITNRREYAELAERALIPVRANIENSDGGNNYPDIGGGSGLASIIYVANKISAMLHLPWLRDFSCLAASRLTIDALLADSKYDILGGCAGSILALLSMPNPSEYLEKLRVCGHQLLEHCDKAYGSMTPSPDGLIGFSHGSAGIAYALWRLSSATGDQAYLNAALQAIEYENLLYDPAEGNWREVTPVYDPASPPLYWRSWCHGAPGIALGRLGCIECESSSQIHSDIATALHTTLHTPLQEIDHACCGNIGRVEIMLTASRKLAEKSWGLHAYDLASQILSRARHRGQFAIFNDFPGTVFNPSFFQGAAGIGYHLLRLARPDCLPCVLLWE
jgi:type 2 lantibiotic biosynthesis protein LanM